MTEFMQKLLDELALRKWTIATAESCTGGMVAAAITDIPGASEYFRGGVVAYHNQIKQQLLGVPQEILSQYGAVSRECVEAMLDGAARTLCTDCVIATSGIAGPGGGTPDKPVGLVFVGCRSPHSVLVEKFMFDGNRQQVRQQAVNAGIAMMKDLINQ